MFKHNDANGEGGRDGSNDNFSWNCGVEGDGTLATETYAEELASGKLFGITGVMAALITAGWAPDG